MYIHIYICICVYVYIYIYIYIHRRLEIAHPPQNQAGYNNNNDTLLTCFGFYGPWAGHIYLCIMFVSKRLLAAPTAPPLAAPPAAALAAPPAAALAAPAAAAALAVPFDHSVFRTFSPPCLISTCFREELCDMFPA